MDIFGVPGRDEKLNNVNVKELKRNDKKRNVVSVPKGNGWNANVNVRIEKKLWMLWIITFN